MACLLIRIRSGANNRKYPNSSDLKYREMNVSHTSPEAGIPESHESLETQVPFSHPQRFSCSEVLMLRGHYGYFQHISSLRREGMENGAKGTYPVIS